jgi:hypothetical protein
LLRKAELGQRWPTGCPASRLTQCSQRMSTAAREPRPGLSDQGPPLPASREQVFSGAAQDSPSDGADMMKVKSLVPAVPVSGPGLRLDTSDPSFATDTLNTSSTSTSNAGSKEVASSKAGPGHLPRMSESGKRSSTGPLKPAKKPCLGSDASFASNSESLGAKSRAGQQLQSFLATAGGAPSFKGDSSRLAHAATSQNSSPAPQLRGCPGPRNDDGGSGEDSHGDAKARELPSESVCTESIGARSTPREASPNSMPQSAPAGKANVKASPALRLTFWGRTVLVEAIRDQGCRKISSSNGNARKH